MNTVKVEKHDRANKRSNWIHNFLQSFIHFSLLVVMFGLFLSSPVWLPSLCSSLKLFFLVSLPNIGSIVFGPKCLFIIFNLIIIFLVGESKLSSSPSTTMPNIYEEYVNHSQCLKNGRESATVVEISHPSVEEKKEITIDKEESVEEKKEIAIEKEEEFFEREEEEEEGGEEVVMREESEEFQEEEEEKGLPAEELNKRVEDFIARVNMQRILEARMVACCG